MSALKRMSALERWKNTLWVWGFGVTKIPTLAWLTPCVEEMGEEKVVVRIPLTWRSRNHLKSMYFGALCAGADVAAGLVAMQAIGKSGKRIDFVFKDVNGKFLKRAEGDVLFTCDAGARVRELVKRAAAEAQRFEETVQVTATVPSKTGDVPVATFEMTLSLKAR